MHEVVSTRVASTASLKLCTRNDLISCARQHKTPRHPSNMSIIQDRSCGFCISVVCSRIALLARAKPTCNGIIWIKRSHIIAVHCNGNARRMIRLPQMRRLNFHWAAHWTMVHAVLRGPDFALTSDLAPPSRWLGLAISSSSSVATPSGLPGVPGAGRMP